MTPRFAAALAALAFVVSTFWTRSAQSFAYDELFTLWVSSRSWPDLVHQANTDGFTPGLFYGLVKALSTCGLQGEDLRILPVALAGVAVFLGLRASNRLFGSESLWVALLVIPGSAYLFSFAHELRPYTGLLACTFFFLGHLGRPNDPKSDVWAKGAALVATTLSYLGFFLILLWVFECRRRASLRKLLTVILIATALCAPGLAKTFGLVMARGQSSIAWAESWPALSSVLFGLAPLPLERWVEAIALGLLAFILVVAYSLKERPALGFLVRAFLIPAALVLLLDAIVRIGFAPRYLALSTAALLLMLVGVLSRAGPVGRLLAAAFLTANVVATSRYLTTDPPARENWREAMGRLEHRLRPDGVLLAFPFHHAAVAADAYAPGLKLGGGYTSSKGPLFWYEPPKLFRGYTFDDLMELDDVDAVLVRVASSVDVCLLSDEPDPEKTEAVFAAFRRLYGVAPFNVGDPRLRVLCRSRGETS